MLALSALANADYGAGEATRLMAAKLLCSILQYRQVIVLVATPLARVMIDKRTGGRTDDMAR